MLGDGALVLLIEELDSYSVAEADEALACFHRRVSDILEAPESMTVFATRSRARLPTSDALNGWLPAEAIAHGPGAARRMQIAREWHASDRLQRVEPTVRALTTGTGRTRAFRRSELGSRRELARAPSTALLEALGVADRMHGAIPVSRDVELHILFDRQRGDGVFRIRDRVRLLLLMRTVGRIARSAARARGYVDAHRPLSPRERTVLGSLLTGDSEKEAAAGLSLTTRSLHQYVVAIYRAFGVRSRAELVAKFL